MYNACPMGLCMSPRLFTKVLKPIFSSLRRNGHQSVIYIDDTYLQGETVDACNQNVMATIEILSNFGFVINSEKLVFYATQKLEFLGFLLNSIEMTVTLTEHKVEKLRSVCSEFLNSKNKTIRDLSVLIGNLVASFPAVPYRQLFYRQLENEKITMLKSSKGNFEARATLFELARSDINW